MIRAAMFLLVPSVHAAMAVACSRCKCCKHAVAMQVFVNRRAATVASDSTTTANKSRATLGETSALQDVKKMHFKLTPSDVKFFQ